MHNAKPQQPLMLTMAWLDDASHIVPLRRAHLRRWYAKSSAEIAHLTPPRVELRTSSSNVEAMYTVLGLRKAPGKWYTLAA
jgi:hypothetical protein